MASIMGWDVGGVNIKAARVADAALPRVAVVPFELQRAPDRLASVLIEAAGALGAEPTDQHAVTMTAELSQFFRTKREGVGFLIDALERAFGAERLHIFGTDGAFHPPARARAIPLVIAAANWMATARLVAQSSRTCVLIDTGSTTTDIIPIVEGEVAASGRTDPDRLASGELIYTGALRTPAEAVAHEVPFRGALAGLSAEGFANTGDVHLWLGALTPEDYTVPTPDGRPATREHAGDRLARMLCGDRDMLGDADIEALARALADAQIGTVAAAIGRVRARHPLITAGVVTGIGDFIAAAAARSAGLSVGRLADRLGGSAAIAAPAAAVAILLAQAHSRSRA